MENLENESVVHVTGKIRPKQVRTTQPQQNDLMELKLEKLDILNHCDKDAIPVVFRNELQSSWLANKENPEISDENRFTHRHIDLRTTRMQRNLRLRSKAALVMRNFLDSKKLFLNLFVFLFRYSILDRRFC